MCTMIFHLNVFLYYEMLLTIELNFTCRKDLQEEDDDTFSRGQATNINTTKLQTMLLIQY